MLSPEDLMEDGTVPKPALSASAFYLHDRNLIELMVGYNPPLFAAVRIAPDGIELYENPVEFNRTFPLDEANVEAKFMEVVPLMLQLAEEAERSGLQGLRLEWLLRDITQLREEFMCPQDEWRQEHIARITRWLDGYFWHDENAQLPTLEAIKALVLVK